MTFVSSFSQSGSGDSGNRQQNLIKYPGYHPVAYDVGDQVIGESGCAGKIYFAIKKSCHDTDSLYKGY